MGRVHFVRAVHTTGADDADGRLTILHRADLRRRGLRPQQQTVAQEEGILHIPRGVILGDIERLEIVVFGFHLRTIHHIKAHRLENVDQVLQHDVQRVQSAFFAVATRHGHIQRFVLQTCRLLRSAHRSGAGFQRFLQLGAHLVHQLTHLGALLGGQCAHAAQQAGERAFFAHHLNAKILQLARLAQRLQLLHRLLAQRFDLFFHETTSLTRKAPVPQKGRRLKLRGTTLIRAAKHGAHSATR